jgi:hypothetical protein
MEHWSCTSTSPGDEEVAGLVSTAPAVGVESPDVLGAGATESVEVLVSVVVLAASTDGVVVGSEFSTDPEDVASTWAEARRISKTLTKVKAKRTGRPTPANAIMFVFIFS